jgi:spoIIIJ-associated protein
MQRFEGKNIDEALANAAQGLGVERYQIRHAVVLEKRGFLGGVKRVVIEAEVNPDAVAPAEPAPAAAVAPIASSPAAAPAPRSRERGRARGDSRRGGGSGGGRRRRREYDDEDDALQPGDFAAAFGEDVPEQTPESDAAQAVRDWCERVLRLAKLSLVVRTEENETQVLVRLYGPDTRRLLERHGELLDALQVLANKSLTGRKVEKDIELDCEGFKANRVEELEQKARDVADRVRRDKREQLLPAMSPIERRIVHLALQDDVEVATESRGDGFYKRVAIVPREAATES